MGLSPSQAPSQALMSDQKTNTVKHQHRTALLIIDMMNTLDFEGGEELLKRALPVAASIRKLKSEVKARGIPVIYVNDNFGQWRSNWEEVYRVCTEKGCRGKPLAQELTPEKDDYFVLKPKHSGFYSTTLEILLESLGTEELILTGIAGNICVLFTANDAHMRDYQLIVPGDCIASNTEEDDQFTLRQLKTVFGIATQPSGEITF